MKIEASLDERLDGSAVRCGTCQRRCLIQPGRPGRKPVFHYYPGSRWLSLGSVGCNFRCPGSQNWEISHWIRGMMDTRYLSPEDTVAEAKAAGRIGLSWTFNEPALWFEYTPEAARAARRAGLRTSYVTNWVITEEARLAIAPYLDVFRVDIKGFFDATYERIGRLGNAGDSSVGGRSASSPASATCTSATCRAIHRRTPTATRAGGS